jgi:phi13 family phage major tail protein
MTIGLKNLVVAPMISDTETGAAYGAVQLLAGAIDAKISPANAEADDQYADDALFDSLTPDAEDDIEIETAGFTIAQLAMLQGHAISVAGDMIERNGDTPPFVALGFKSQKSAKYGGGYRYVWIYKAKPQMMEQTFHTKEGKTVTRQTGKVKFKAAARIYDGLSKLVTDVLSATFFNAPVVPVLPVITIGTQPAASTAVTEGSITGELSVAATVSPSGGVLTYQWFKALYDTNTAGAALVGETADDLTIPAALTEGEYWFYCEVYQAANGVKKASNTAKVTVAAGGEGT